MEDISYIAIVIGIVVPTVIFIAVALIVCIIRRRIAANNPGYAQVDHELDEEEIEFQRFIESQHSRGDDLDGLFLDQSLSLDDTTHESDISRESIDPDTFIFDEEERSHLSILEKFRNSLVLQATEPEVQTGAERPDRRDIEVGSPEGVLNPIIAVTDDCQAPPDEIRM